MKVDELDAKIVRLFTEEQRMSVLEASRILKVARATVQARLDRMISQGIIARWAPEPEPRAFGFPVVAFCFLTINQDLGHDAVSTTLAEIPEVIEVHTVSGDSDLMARVAARSNSDLQRVLDVIMATKAVVRSSSVIALNTHFEGRTLPLLEAAARS